MRQLDPVERALTAIGQDIEYAGGIDAHIADAAELMPSPTDHGTSNGPAVRIAASAPSASTKPAWSSGPVVQVLEGGQPSAGPATICRAARTRIVIEFLVTAHDGG